MALNEKVIIFETACADRADFVKAACAAQGLEYTYEYRPSYFKEHKTIVFAEGNFKVRCLNMLAAAVTAHPGEMDARKEFRRLYMTGEVWQPINRK